MFVAGVQEPVPCHGDTAWSYGETFLLEGDSQLGGWQQTPPHCTNQSKAIGVFQYAFVVVFTHKQYLLNKLLIIYVHVLWTLSAVRPALHSTWNIYPGDVVLVSNSGWSW